MPSEILMLGVLIGSNNFAAALALGSLGQSSKLWRIVTVFGSFEFLIPLVGLWLGRQTSAVLAKSFGWLGPSLLVALGAWAIFSVRKSSQNAERLTAQITTWRGIVTLAAGLSIDNLVAGFSLGLGEVDPLKLATAIAAFSVCFTLVGLRLGSRAGERHRRMAEKISGLLLIALGLALAFGLV